MDLPQVTIFKLCSLTELLNLQILLGIAFTFPSVSPVDSREGGTVEGQPFA